MTKIYFGTVVRKASFQKGGKLICLNWDTKEIEAEKPVIPENPSLENLPNPRKTGQGCRGITFYRDMIIASNYHTLQFYDKGLRPKGIITHNLLADIHEIYRNGENKLFVTSTAIDAVLKFDIERGEVEHAYWPREMPVFQKALHLTPLSIDKSVDNRSKFIGTVPYKHAEHLHLNCVVEWKGEVFALFHSFGVLANLSREEIVLEDLDLKGAHNLIITDEGVAILNDTRRCSVRFYDINKKKFLKKINLLKFPWVRYLKNIALVTTFFDIPQKISKKLFRLELLKADPLFVRGLDIKKNLLFIGMSPASIVCIDLRKDELVDAFCYSRNVRNCIHGLRVLT
jgi:hypothetical protein